ncbi:unnamed protein product, partial [marine sediment metagenome]
SIFAISLADSFFKNGKYVIRQGDKVKISLITAKTLRKHLSRMKWVFALLEEILDSLPLVIKLEGTSGIS